MTAGGFDHPSVELAWFPVAEYGTVQLGDRTVPRAVQVEIGDPLSDGPMVYVRLEIVGDRPQCREVRFASKAWSAAGPGRELRQGDLESLRLADLIEHVFVLSTWPTFSSHDEWRAAAPELRKAVGAARRGRSARKVNRAFLERVAGVYRRNVDDRPTQTVADAFGIAHSTAAEYVRRARAEGLLPPTTSGKRKA